MSEEPTEVQTESTPPTPLTQTIFSIIFALVFVALCVLAADKFFKRYGPVLTPGL
jgi:branched-subunit amino acid permease